MEDEAIQEAFINSGVIVSWMKQCEYISNSTERQVELKVLAMELMCKISKTYPDVVDEADQDLSKVIEILKRNSRGDSAIVRVNAINRLFDLLEECARTKNRFAPLIYKKMIFLFLENHDELEIR